MCVCVCVCVSHLNSPVCRVFEGSDVKSDGFSLQTCRSIISLLDVSFTPEHTDQYSITVTSDPSLCGSITVTSDL